MLMDEIIAKTVQSLLIIGTFTFYWNMRNSFFVITERTFIAVSTTITFLNVLSEINQTFLDISGGMFLRIFPVILGIMFFIGMTRYRWVLRYPNALLTGGGLGVLFGLSIRAQILAQISSSVTDIVTAFSEGPAEILSSLIVFTGSIIVLSYFVFRRPTGKYGAIRLTGNKVATWIMSITFGNLYSQLMLVRLDNLVESFKRILVDFLLALFK